MEEFGLYLCIGILVILFITLKSRFDKIDGNLSVLNKKLDQLNKIGIVTGTIIPENKTETVQDYKPAITIIPNNPIVEQTEGIISNEPEIIPPTIIPIYNEEGIDKNKIEKVAFSNDSTDPKTN